MSIMGNIPIRQDHSFFFFPEIQYILRLFIFFFCNKMFILFYFFLNFTILFIFKWLESKGSQTNRTEWDPCFNWYTEASKRL